MTYGDFRCLENYDGGALFSSEQYRSIVVFLSSNERKYPRVARLLIFDRRFFSTKRGTRSTIIPSDDDSRQWMLFFD